MNAVYQSGQLKRCVVAEEGGEEEEGERTGSRKRGKKTPRDQRHFYSFVFPSVRLLHSKRKTLRSSKQLHKQRKDREEIGTKTTIESS